VHLLLTEVGATVRRTQSLLSAKTPQLGDTGLGVPGDVHIMVRDVSPGKSRVEPYIWELRSV
jgi:hypothetical protein